MASFNIHLAVAKRYTEKNKTINYIKRFYEGTLAPDLASNKRISHYSGIADKSNLSTYLLNKVILPEYLKVNDILTDYEKGFFLHLITDYLFFNDFFNKDYIEKTPYNIFCNDLYYSYNVTNKYLENKYKISMYDVMDAKKIDENIEASKKEKNTEEGKGNNILPEDKLDAFIEIVSDINLEDYKNKILAENIN